MKFLAVILVSCFLVVDCFAQGPKVEIQIPVLNQETKEVDYKSVGRGVVVHKTSIEHENGYLGYVATCFHVGEGLSHYKVLYDNNEFSSNCFIVRGNKFVDIMLLYVWMPKDTKVAEIADGFAIGEEIHGVLQNSDEARLGRSSKGLIINLSRDVIYFSDLVVRLGDSGSPVWNKNNQLVGIVRGGYKLEDQSLELKEKELWPSAIIAPYVIRTYLNDVLQCPLPCAN